MNFSVLPDFAAIGGLIAVFWTLLRRTGQTRLNFWLVGWFLLLVHIVALFVAQNTSGSANGAYSVAVGMLVIVASAFVWASNEQLDIKWRNLSIVVFSALPDVALLSLITYGIESAWLYATLTLMGIGSTLWMMSAWRGFMGARCVSGSRLCHILHGAELDVADLEAERFLGDAEEAVAFVGEGDLQSAGV